MGTYLVKNLNGRETMQDARKRFFRLLGFLLACCLPSGHLLAQTCVQPPSGMIACWALDETRGTLARDIAGNNPGVYVNGPLPAPGNVGGALRFNGSNQYVGAPDSDIWAFGTGNFTVELWANFDAPGSGDIVHAGDI